MARVQNSETRRAIAFVVAIATLIALVVPLVGTAVANHNNCRLNVEPETAENPTGATHTLTATVSTFGQADASTQTSTAGQCDPEGASGQQVEVDFEIVGVGDSDPGSGGTPSGFTPDQPDLTCTITVTENGNAADDFCVVGYTSQVPGNDTIWGWIDHDRNNATTSGELDPNEGQNVGPGGTNQQPGNQSEPDTTDVVTKRWFGDIPGGATLDCDDDDNDDTETNPPDQAETYTCRVFTDVNDNNQFDAGGATPDQPLTSVRIDAEQEGANDPDNRAFNAAGNTADRDNACTTDSTGRCAISIAPSENEVGESRICFWTDADNDGAYDPLGSANDGGGCDEETATDETFSGNENRRRTDVVQKTWAPSSANGLDAEPENDANNVGSQHTVTATLTDQFGNPIQNVPVDFDIEGRNDSGSAAEPEAEGDQVLTNSQGQASFTYTDRGTNIASGFQTDTITVCADPSNTDDCAGGTNLGTAPEPAGTEDADLVDVVQKFWFQQVPSANSVLVDMDVTFPDTCGQDDPTTDANPVDSLHTVCAVVRDSNNQAIPGKTVVFTLSGPGTIVRDPNTPANTADDRDLGRTFTTNADQNGQAQITIYSTQAGNTVVTATSDGRSDTGTKPWAGETVARTIDCNPESAQNQPGTTHLVTCTVRDRFGNPVTNSQVFFTESGPGRIVTPSGTPPSATTNASGNAEVTVTSASNETGVQTITGRLAADATPATGEEESVNTDDECEQPAGSTLQSQSEAARPSDPGVCADDVTKTWTTTPTTPPPPGENRTVTLESSRNKLKFRQSYTLTVTVRATDTATTPAECVAGVTVTLVRTVVGTTDVELLDTAVTDSLGTASFARQADRSANYVAAVEENSPSGCSASVSGAEPVLVRKLVRLSASRPAVRPGRSVRLTARVTPCQGHAGDRVTLWLSIQGTMAKIDTDRTDASCTAVFRRTIQRRSVFQARSPKQDPDHLGGRSRKVAVGVRR